jgi:hypothetical protein
MFPSSLLFVGSLLLLCSLTHVTGVRGVVPGIPNVVAGVNAIAGVSTDAGIPAFAV